MTNPKPKRIKFSPYMLKLKAKVKELRISRCLPMLEAADKLGISLKTLEDYEALRNYGAHLTPEIICKMCRVYGFSSSQIYLNLSHVHDTELERPIR